ncbi:hypothetical protein DB347_08705 [Opitutaceae bacterium EW11]|nr:hypothetical protein DB347_08705 [Opitutaceae bacterium EW11]
MEDFIGGNLWEKEAQKMRPQREEASVETGDELGWKPLLRAVVRGRFGACAGADLGRPDESQDKPGAEGAAPSICVVFPRECGDRT